METSLSGLEVGSQRWSCFLRAEAGSEVDLALGLWRSILYLCAMPEFPLVGAPVMGSRAHPKAHADVVFVRTAVPRYWRLNLLVDVETQTDP